MQIKRDDFVWSVKVASAFQRLIGVLEGHVTSPSVDQVLQGLREPHNQSERILVRYLVARLLLRASLLPNSVVRRDILNAILHVWPSIEHHQQPLSLVQRAVRLEAPSTSKGDVSVAEQVCRILARRYSERLRMRDIAEELGISESKLQHSFRRAAGSTIHTELISVRVRHGLALLLEGHKVESAALAVGFKSKKDFYRAVRRLVGCTPAQFRDSFRKTS